jgi:hypothetical protein
MLIKSRGVNMYDVFYGSQGWDQWALFKRERNRLMLVKGASVPSAVYAEACKTIIGR